MGNAEIREPSQKRSIEKKEKIIKYGFQLICEKGYHNTNTVEIAKAAGVSTGIIYQYFKDKRDIFINGIDQYAKSLMFPFNDIASKTLDKNNLYDTISLLIELSIKNHAISKDAHEEITSLQHSDLEVAEIFRKYEEESTNKLVEILKKNKFKRKNLLEKSHLIVSIIDNFCHEVIYHKHAELNYDQMKELVINSIIIILKKL